MAPMGSTCRRKTVRQRKEVQPDCDLFNVQEPALKPEDRILDVALQPCSGETEKFELLGLGPGVP